MTTALTVAHPTTGEPLPPFLTARQAGELLGRPEHWIADACARGELPTLPNHVDGAPWSIPTLELLRAAGFSLAPSLLARPEEADERRQVSGSPLPAGDLSATSSHQERAS